MRPTPVLPDRQRRRVLAAALALGGGALLSSRLLSAQEPLRPTPSVALGPFYPPNKPADSDADLTIVAGRSGRAAGTLLHVDGRVLDTRGRPIANARIELWQANAYGRYIHPGDTDASGPLDPNFQGYAVLRTDAEGRYRIRTVKPAPYGWRTPHLHFIFAGGPQRLVTQMFFEGEKMNERDGLYVGLDREDRRAATGRWTDRGAGMEAGALAVAWDVVLRA